MLVTDIYYNLGINIEELTQHLLKAVTVNAK